MEVAGLIDESLRPIPFAPPLQLDDCGAEFSLAPVVVAVSKKLFELHLLAYANARTGQPDFAH
ncbi:MAG: hypothetical protein NVSMB42_10260 [Herpetosiphon sp.]